MRDTLLTTVSTLRLTRFVTQDSLGEWLFYDPAEKWAIEHEGSHLTYADHSPALDEDRGWRSKLVSGLACPWCVGFWLGAANLVATSAVSNTPLERPLRIVKTALALNYVVGHISSRLDSTTAAN